MNLTSRNDHDMPFLLNFETTAWYEDGCVRILDRRIYPIKTEFVICKNHTDVARAIKDMVTQSEGPYSACLMGMALAVYEVKNEPADRIIAYATKAADVLSTARPTTSAEMIRLCHASLDTIRQAVLNGISGNDLVDVAFKFAYDYINGNYARYDIIGRNLAELFPNDGAVMTVCFAGTVIGTMLRYCKQHNKNIRFYCCETRPYYQGARLTASCCNEMGFDTTVICDGMAAYTMKSKCIDVLTTAADVITCSGDVCNKVGTFQAAMAADHYKIPYYVTGTPDPSYKDASGIRIEERDPFEVISSLGTRTTEEGVKGYYPAFDITPPKFVTGIVTDKGIFKPDELNTYFVSNQ